jgi:hypothetical protein
LVWGFFLTVQNISVYIIKDVSKFTGKENPVIHMRMHFQDGSLGLSIQCWLLGLRTGVFLFFPCDQHDSWVIGASIPVKKAKQHHIL